MKFHGIFTLSSRRKAEKLMRMYVQKITYTMWGFRDSTPVNNVAFHIDQKHLLLWSKTFMDKLEINVLLIYLLFIYASNVTMKRQYQQKSICQ